MKRGCLLLLVESVGMAADHTAGGCAATHCTLCLSLFFHVFSHNYVNGGSCCSVFLSLRSPA